MKTVCDVDDSADKLVEQANSSSWGLSPDADSASSDSFSTWDLRCCFCFSELRDRQAGLIILSAVMYFMATALTAIPLQLLINLRIAGNSEQPTAASAFVVATTSLLHSLVSFLFARYSSGMGDYIGRKPVLFLSSLCFLLSRLVYLDAKHPYGFYFGGILGGAFDCYYFSTLAWICDLFPEGSRRSKRVGLFTGVVGGFGFALGVPLGAVIAEYKSIELVFHISIVLSAVNCVCLVLLPIDDTIGARCCKAPKKLILGTRYRPAETITFLIENFPVSASGMVIVRKARSPMDWLANFLMHCTTALLNLILIQYCFAVFHWSAISSAAALLSVGVCLGIFAPLLLHRYSPIPLAFYMMVMFTCGLIVLSIAGTGLDNGPTLGILGIICIALGMSWVPALQTNLLSQYGPDVQGVVSGILSQQKEAALVPAYVMSLGFTVSLGQNEPIYWPGSAFAAV